jgi:hypothetical protein
MFVAPVDFLENVRNLSSKDMGQPHKNYVVHVDGHLVRNGVWKIDAKLRFRKGTKLTLGERLFGEGRLALLDGIRREGLRGRSHGATSVRVHMDIDGEVRDIALGDLIDDSETTH